MEAAATLVDVRRARGIFHLIELHDKALVAAAVPPDVELGEALIHVEVSPTIYICVQRRARVALRLFDVCKTAERRAGRQRPGPAARPKAEHQHARYCGAANTSHARISTTLTASRSALPRPIATACLSCGAIMSSVNVSSCWARRRAQ